MFLCVCWCIVGKRLRNRSSWILVRGNVPKACSDWPWILHFGRELKAPPVSGDFAGRDRGDTVHDHKCTDVVSATMTSRGANEVSGRRQEVRSTNPWSKLVIAGTVGGACTVVTACFVLCILVCRRMIRDKRT